MFWEETQEGIYFITLHLGGVYVPFRGHDLWPTSLNQNTLDINNLVSGVYLSDGVI